MGIFFSTYLMEIFWLGTHIICYFGVRLKSLVNHHPRPAANHFCQRKSLRKDNGASGIEKDVAEVNAEHINGAFHTLLHLITKLQWCCRKAHYCTTVLVMEAFLDEYANDMKEFGAEVDDKRHGRRNGTHDVPHFMA